MAQHINTILPGLLPTLLQEQDDAPDSDGLTEEQNFTTIEPVESVPTESSLSTPTLVLRDVLIKTSGAIAIEVEIPLVARQLWNILIAAAYNHLGTVRTHRLPLRLIFQKLGLSSHSYVRLQEQLTLLLNANVQQWNIFKKDKRIWSGTKLLAAATIDEAQGIVKYEFSTELEHLLKVNSEEKTPYTTLSLKTQSLFSSKYAQILYEYLTDACDMNREKSETAWIPIGEYQAMLGKRYDRWEITRQRLVEEPLEQVQPMLPFTVEWKTQRLTRKVTHIKFLFAKRSVEEIQKIAKNLTPPPKDYQPLFEALSPEEQEIIYNEAMKRLPAFIREDYIDKKPILPGTYQRIVYPIWLGYRNAMIDEFEAGILPLEAYSLHSPAK
jgi:Initiator Replication protein